jgi:hypothetical protein
MNNISKANDVGVMSRAYLSIQLTRCIIIPHIIFEVPLDSAKLLISLLGEFDLQPYHGFEAGIEIWDPEVQKLW